MKILVYKRMFMIGILSVLLILPACSANNNLQKVTSVESNYTIPQKCNDSELSIVEVDCSTDENTDEMVSTNESDNDVFLPFDNLICPILTEIYNDVLSDNISDIDNIEEIACILTKRNLICAYLFYTSVAYSNKNPININENGYYEVKFLLFDDYSKYESFVRDTYVQETADKLINDIVGNGAAFIEQNGKVLFDPNRTGFANEPHFILSDGYTVKITGIESNLVNFEIFPLLSDKLSQKEYDDICELWGEDFHHSCCMVLDGDVWKLSSMTYVF